MVDRAVSNGRAGIVRYAALVVVMWVVSLAQAHDFGGQSGGGDEDSPPPKPPCNSCPCSGPGGSAGGGGGGGGGPGNSNRNPWGGDGKPVSFYDGAEEMTGTDLVVNGIFPITIQRKYDSRSTYDSPLGYGWAFFHDRRLYEYPDNSVVVRHGCGTRDRYVYSGGAYVTPTGSMLATLSEESDGTFRLKYLNGLTDTFDSQGRLIAVTDARGNRHEYTYDSRGKLALVGSSKESITPTQPMTAAYNYRLTRIDVRGADGALTGRFVTFEYDENTGRLASVAADDGRTVTYEHDVSGTLTLGNLTQVNGLEGIVSTYVYADSLDPHNLTSITPAQDRTPIVNTYDDQDRVTRQEEGTRRMDMTYNVAYTRTTVTKTISDPNGQNATTAVTTYEFDTTGRVTKVTDPLGHETRYTYNAAKLLAQEELWQKDSSTLSLLQATNWTFDANGNKLSEIVTLDSGERITRSWTYDNNWIASEQVVSNFASAKIFRTEYTFYYGTDGVPTNVQSKNRRKDDGSFQTTSYTYDGRNRLLTTTLPDGVQILNEYTGDYVTRTSFVVDGSEIPQLQRQFEYDAQGNRTKEWDARNNLTQHGYDNRGRLTSTTNPLGEQTLYTYSQKQRTQIDVGHTVADGEGQVTKLVYDARDRITGIQRKTDAGAFVDYQTFQLDSEGRRVSVTDGENRTTSFTYDLLGRVKTTTDPLNNTTQFEYDAAGNRILVRDALNREVKYEFDDLNRLTGMVEFGVTPNPHTKYGYDAANNLVSVTDAENHKTTYEYDALSRNTRVTQPLGQSVQYVYDDRGRLDTLINARGHRLEYDYESWGGLSAQRQYPTSSATTPDRTMTYAYDNGGNVITITDDDIQPGPIYSLTYDALNRPYDETVKYLPGGDRVLQHRYDRYGNRNELTFQDGSATLTSTYTHNQLNQLTAANLTGAALDLTYFGNDDRQSVTLPNGVTESFMYRANGPMESLTINGPSGQIAQLAYTYDEVLNIDTQTDPYGEHDFNYDGLNRLTQALRPTASGLPNESYSYDGVGNREDPSDAALYGYDGNNRITASPALTYTFDADGSLLTRSDGASFTHDPNARLVQFAKGSTTAAYLYEPGGRRIRKEVDGTITWFLWDGTRLLAEFDSSGNRTKRYAYLEGDYAPTLLEDSNGEYYVHSDHLRTPRFATDPTGEVVWRSRHEAFGQAVVENDVDGNSVAVELNVRFPGQYLDAETGLHYNYFRDYDPSTGRYIQSDPIGLEGGFNTYAYANNNPLAFIDPYGLDATDWGNTSGGRSRFNGPTNGNWGGKCWSGGKYSCGKEKPGDKPPTDSGDQCYKRHDECYVKCGGDKLCIAACDNTLVDELLKLPNDPRKWPDPPRRGTERDSRTYRDWAIRFFGD